MVNGKDVSQLIYPRPPSVLTVHGILHECGMNIFKSLKTKDGQSSNFWFSGSGLISSDHSTDAVKFQLGNKHLGSVSPCSQDLVLIGFILIPRQSVQSYTVYEATATALLLSLFQYPCTGM